MADAASNPAPLIDWAAGYRIGKLIVTVTVAALTGFAMWRLHRTNHPNRLALDLSIIGIAAMLLLPATRNLSFSAAGVSDRAVSQPFTRRIPVLLGEVF
ncbi:MAG: hypothetical protein R3C26_22610 [Calditrichia bacterium]